MFLIITEHNRLHNRQQIQQVQYPEGTYSHIDPDWMFGIEPDVVQEDVVDEGEGLDDA